MLATCICLNGSLLDQLSCTIVYLHNLFTCTFGRINMSVCLSGVNRLGDTSAFVIPAGQLLLTRRGKTRMYIVGIVFELYTVPL